MEVVGNQHSIPYPIRMLNFILKLRGLVFLVALLLFACNDDRLSETKPVEIIVSTGFGSVSGIETRGGGSINTADILDNSLPVSIVRLDQAGELDPSYLPYTAANEDGRGQAPRSGRLAGFNSDIRMEFDTEEYYLSRPQNNSTKLIAWYPAVSAGGSVWNVEDDVATVRFTVDGDTDILMSDLVEGSRESPYSGGDKKLSFKHLLTRIRVRVYTLDETAATVWGGLETITIAGKAQTCIARLPGADALTPAYPSVTFEGSGALPLVREDTDVLPIPQVEAYTANDDAGMAGYAMIAPESGALYLAIKTEQKDVPSLKLKLPAAGLEAGKSYTFALEFLTKGIEMMCVTVHDWETDEIIDVEI